MSNPTEKPTPTPEDVTAHLRQTFPEYFTDLGERFTPDTTFEEAKLDSLAVVEVVLSLEERYELPEGLEDEEVSACKTPCDLAAACRRALGLS